MKSATSVNRQLRLLMRLVLIAGGMSVIGCGGAHEINAPKPEEVQGLDIQKIRLRIVADELEVPGNVISVSTAQVAARTMGTVLKVAGKEGDLVKRGQLLAQLDERELSSNRSAAQAGAQAAIAGVAQATKELAASQAQADFTQKTYERYAYLKEQKSVSPQEFDEINSRRQATQANLEQARAGLLRAEAVASQAESGAHAAQEVASYAWITAPFDGRVIRRSIEPGSLISPGMLLFVVEDPSHYQLESALPAQASLLAKKGVPVRVQLDNLADKSLMGKVAEIEAGADPNSHTLKARIDLPKDSGVQSGMFGRAFFPQGEKHTLLIPSGSIVNRGQLRGVFLVDDSGLLHWRVVTLGKAFRDQVEVLSGISEGEALVLNPGNQELDGKRASAAGTRGEKHP